MTDYTPDREQIKAVEQLAVRATLDWSGWGSPVGVSILLVAVGVFLVCLHAAGILH